MTLLTILLEAAVAGAYMAKIGAALGAAITAMAAGYGIGRIGASAMEAIARQPEASKSINTSMMLSAAFIEGVALFAVIVCLLAVVL